MSVAKYSFQLYRKARKFAPRLIPRPTQKLAQYSFIYAALCVLLFFYSAKLALGIYFLGPFVVNILASYKKPRKPREPRKNPGGRSRRKPTLKAVV